MSITTEAYVIACFVCWLLVDVIGNVTVADVKATYNTKADVIAYCVILLLTDVVVNFCGGYYVHIFWYEKMLYFGWCYCHIWLWQMLLPLSLMLLPVILFYFIFNFIGWCYCQLVTDVMATFYVMWWQMLLPSGRWYGHYRVGDGSVADVITTGQMVLPGVNILFYFSLTSEMISRTSSHMCGRWYLPTFLFRDGLLTLMYRASFIALLRLCSSFPTMLKSSTLMSWPVMLWWSNMGRGPFDVL